MKNGSFVSPESTAVAESPEARAERLRKLKAAIEGGYYFVSSEDLADRLISRMLLN